MLLKRTAPGDDHSGSAPGNGPGWGPHELENEASEEVGTAWRTSGGVRHPRNPGSISDDLIRTPDVTAAAANALSTGGPAISCPGLTPGVLTAGGGFLQAVL